MNGKQCEWRNPEIKGVAPKCPKTSEDDSLYCTEHRDWGWAAAHAEARKEEGR